MFGHNAFDGLFAALIVVGIVLGLLIFGLPMYYLGKQRGTQAVYDEAMKNNVLMIRYDPITGDKILIWRKP